MSLKKTTTDSTHYQVDIVDAFPRRAGGGNPVPIVINADGMSDREMQELAHHHGYESCFVLSTNDKNYDYQFRFFVPRHEMEMCGHATIGTLWLLHQKKHINFEDIRIKTLSGLVIGRVSNEGSVEISQPPGEVEILNSASVREKIIKILSLSNDDLLDIPIVNAKTSRIKTLIGLRNDDILNGMKPDFSKIENFCDSISSTGLYPFSIDANNPSIFHARQFPQSAGYPEDAATGIAATALAFGVKALNLIDHKTAGITVWQGEAMARPSEITVTYADSGNTRSKDFPTVGCWLGGKVCFHS